MNEKSTKKEPDEVKRFSDSDFSRSLCSSMDCTGLIPALPSSEAELEAYEEMYQFCQRSIPVSDKDAANCFTPSPSP